ncbi:MULTISPECIES: hypothetical protein [Enterobacteriaceae]|nr:MULTISPECIES: hypothetical protein [unclassified Enterobacter]
MAQANADDYKVAFKDQFTELAYLVNKGSKKEDNTTAESQSLTAAA